MQRPKLTAQGLQEILWIVGFGSFAAGLWRIEPSAALIAGGALLMFIGWPRGSRP